MTKKASGLIDSPIRTMVLGLLSFVESALLIPIITDPFMAAYILVHRDQSDGGGFGHHLYFSLRRFCGLRDGCFHD